MNYKKLYFQIIQKRLSNPLPVDVYGQKHHIFPKSLYPQYAKEKSNIIRLSAREHYICHILLWKYYKSLGDINATYKMANALTFMIRRLSLKNSHDFERVRIDAANYISSINKGRELTSEQCKRRSESQKGEKHFNYGGHLTEQHKQKISAGIIKAFKDPTIKRKHKESLNSEETKRKMREAKLGFSPWNKGVSNCFSEETRKQISDSLKQYYSNSSQNESRVPWNKGKTTSDEVRKKISEKTKLAMKRPEVIEKLRYTYRKVLCEETNIVYNSIKEAKELTGINNISACCRGKIKYAGGYHWKYADEVNNEESLV